MYSSIDPRGFAFSINDSSFAIGMLCMFLENTDKSWQVHSMKMGSRPIVLQIVSKKYDKNPDFY
jgi:hypothetical protein